MKKEIYEVKNVQSSQICADDYQRTPRPKEVKKILDHWDDRKVNPLKISYRDGKFWVFDGQHTLVALKERSGGRDLMAKCLVYYGMTHDDEAYQFSHQDDGKTQVSTNSKLRSSFRGNDEKVLKFIGLVEKIGFYIDFTNSPAQNKIAAIAKAYQIYEHTTNAEFSLILRTVKNTWNGTSDSLRTEILGGTYELLKEHAGKIDVKRFAEKLANANLMKMIADGRVIPYGGDKRFANQMVYAYNKGLRDKRLHEIY